MLVLLRRSLTLVLLGLLASNSTEAQRAPTPDAEHALTLPARINGELTKQTDRVELTLANGTRPADRYTLTLERGQRATVRMESSAFDTYLKVLRNDTFHARNDDHEGSRDVSQIVLTSPETYTLLAGAFSDSDNRGRYTLSVSSSGGEVSPPSSTSSTPGSRTRQATLADDDSEIVLPSLDAARKVDGYSSETELRTGDVLVVTMESTAFDTYLALAIGSRFVAYNDDDGSTQRSEIRYTIPEDGQYVILASSYTEDGRGPYSLTWRVESSGSDTGTNEPEAPVTPTPSAQPPSDPNARVHPRGLPLQIPQVNSLDPDGPRAALYAFRIDASTRTYPVGPVNRPRRAQVYTITLNEGDQVTLRVTMERENITVEPYPYISYYTSGQPNDRHSFENAVTLDEPETYTIYVWEYGDYGEFQGTLEVEATDAPAESSSSGGFETIWETPDELDEPNSTVEPGESVSGQISDSDAQVPLIRSNDLRKADAYRVELRAGQTLITTMESTGFDTYLKLMRGDTFAARNDDAGSTRRSEIRHSATTSGTYTIYAGTFTEGGRGTYTLSWRIE